MAKFLRSPQDATGTRVWSTEDVRLWTACYIKNGNSEDVKFTRIKEVFDQRTQITEQIAAMVFEAWMVLIEDGVWKIRISPGVRPYKY